MNFAINFADVFSFDRLFQTTLPSTFSLKQEVFLIFIVITVLSFLVQLVNGRLFNKEKHESTLKQYVAKISQYYMMVGLFGLFFWFSRVEGLSIFAMRFWLLLTFTIGIGMIGYFYYEFKHILPLVQQQHVQLLEKQKYLPKKKKKK